MDAATTRLMEVYRQRIAGLQVQRERMMGEANACAGAIRTLEVVLKDLESGVAFEDLQQVAMHAENEAHKRAATEEAAPPQTPPLKVANADTD